MSKNFLYGKDRIRMEFIMKMIYETERLSLRILNESYYMQVLTFLSRNQELFDQYEVDKPPLYYTADYQRRLLQQEYNQIIKGNRIRFYIFLKQNSQRIIGTVSFTDFHSVSQSCQIGYKFDPNYHHQGYAYESISHALSLVIPEYNFHRIEAHIQPRNYKSIHLIERLGFELEGTAREYAYIGGKWLNHLQYSFICS